MNRLEVISAEVDGRTCHGVMEVKRSGDGVRIVVHYGDYSQEDSKLWGTDEREKHNMKVIAESLLLQFAQDARKQ